MRNSGWSGDRMPRNRVMLIALPLIVTMAVGLIVGIRLVSEKNSTLRLSNTGQGTANSTPAAPATPAPAASPSVTPSPTAAATATAPATPTAAATNMSYAHIGPASTANAAARAGARLLVDGLARPLPRPDQAGPPASASGAESAAAASPAAARAAGRGEPHPPPAAATAPMAG